VLEGGVPTATNQSSLAASTASSATVLMSEGIVTEVTFTVDPPALVTAPLVTATPTAAQVVALSAATQLLATPAAQPSSTPRRNAKIAAQIASVKGQIKMLQKKLSSKHLRKAARRADAKKLSALRARERGLLRELK
jgi:hypothetical protein